MKHNKTMKTPKDWNDHEGSPEENIKLAAKWANLQQMRDRGRAAYEADIVARPRYHDGSARKTWEQLGDVEQWSWGRRYNLENVGDEYATPERLLRCNRLT